MRRYELPAGVYAKIVFPDDMIDLFKPCLPQRMEYMVEVGVTGHDVDRSTWPENALGLFYPPETEFSIFGCWNLDITFHDKLFIAIVVLV